MASVGSKECITSEEEKQNLVSNEGPEVFQKMLYNLFEKHGILNDLRAYLRSHIVDVLKSAQTGELPACQKHFTQRLEFTSQALNILLAEYFLRYEFSYSLSVFISEIPLANMVFGFAKTLLQNDKENSELRFEDSDVWTILNYLGIQCDSEHAASVLEMYRNEKQSPLLLCILKSMPMYQMPNLENDHANSSEESLLTPRGSADTLKNSININSMLRNLDGCKHYSMCKPCQNRMGRIKEKYKRKKKALAKNKQCEVNPNAVENVMKNITVMERAIMDEMFEHLKSVYETEVEMVKVEEENKVKRSMVTHQQQLQKKCDELEESFKAREEELERNIQQKKQFLWGLARALREQHESLTKAMRDVKLETGRLTAKEHSLKSQLAEAETILKQRSEEMRLQISQELAILSDHLESMKNERDSIIRERSELESLKASKTNSNDDLVCSQYDIVQNELALLRKYVETSQVAPKCVIERGTNTELDDNVNLNNTQERSSKLNDFESRLKANQLVNDFRKKNVNFNQGNNMDDIFVEQRERSRSSGSSEAGDTFCPEVHFDRERTLHLIRRLRDENQRLRRQQRDYVERLDNASTSQPPPPPHPIVTRPVPTTLSAGAISSGWCKGAGEELSVFVDAQPRILVPGDTLPFVGVLRDRHPARRQLISQWRSTRARWPVAGVSKRSISPLRDRIVCNSLAAKVSLRCQGQTPFSEEQPNTSSLCREKQHQRKTLDIIKSREKSPKSVLREAKQKLRNKSFIKSSPAPNRDKSPNTVLRDAKMRLRKLEIEAEAVEESYRNFRKRQNVLSNERSLKIDETLPDKDIVETIDTRRLSPQTINRNMIGVKSQTIVKTPPIDIPNLMTSISRNYDNFLNNYNKINIEQSYLSNELSKRAEEHHPQNVIQENLLEKPLIEFRKLYRSERQFKYENNHPHNIESSNKVDSNNSPSEGSLRKDALKKVKDDKEAEFEILKQNINKMYNISNQNCTAEFALNDEPVKDTENIIEDNNVLQIEVESASEIHDISSSNNLLVVVSSVEARHITISASNGSSEVSTYKPKKRDKTSPKCIKELTEPNSPEKHKRSESPEKAANLTRNDVLDAIFHAEPAANTSSVLLQPSKEAIDSTSECEKDYADDFSADVDNYNSRSDYNSPISQAKTSEDENFWESSNL